MKLHYRLALGAGMLVILTTLVLWQGSFTFGDYGPASPEQTYIFWGLSSLIFLLTVLVGFLLFRTAVKLYFERRANREGSRIRTKIVVGALTLSVLPTVWLFIWSVEVLNRNLDKWFSRPGENIRIELIDIGMALEEEAARGGQALAQWLADSSQVAQFLKTGQRPTAFLAKVCASEGLQEAFILRPDGGQISLCETRADPPPRRPARELTAKAALEGGGQVVVRTHMAANLAASERVIQEQVRMHEQLATARKETRRFYMQLLVLITLFVLFVAMWSALILARQITTPINALLDAARAVSGGDLAHRVHVGAIDEFATLVRSFNEMTADLQANRNELERRRRFIEAVLENIPAGVLSVSVDGTVLLVNKALGVIFPGGRFIPGARVQDEIPAEQRDELMRLLKRARRTGSAMTEQEMRTPHGVRNISLTVSVLEAKAPTGYVVVVEDTTELLRAQKAEVWHEVARRIAHEIKNPLTPITLCSERIVRQLDKTEAAPEVRRILTECAATIAREAESVRALVDEFAMFARWPAAQLAPGDLNATVEEGLAVFAGRLDGIDIQRELAAGLPPVNIDREQFKRVIVNLVDNAAEAMRDAPVKQLYIATRALAADAVELVVADTGCGISTDDKEKLFLPYFSTKKRGTGLGLAIVSHIVTEHQANIRVEDNQPAGARFIVELPALSFTEAVA